MMDSKAGSSEQVSAGVTKGQGAQDSVRGGGVFKVECFDAQGNLKWEAESHNLVVNVGLKDMNDKYFLGSNYTATWYIGLYGAGASNNPAAGDTMASHAGWTEVVPYSNATRPIATFAAASTADPSVITNSASPAVFNINATETVGGAFLTSNNTKSGTTGILFSAADFAAPGDRNVTSGDTLSVTYTFSLDAL
jgi:hypothetical protein